VNQILPYTLWIGHAGDGRDYRRILDCGIKAVVYLAAEELPSELPREVISCRFPLLDGAGNEPDVLALAMQTTAALVKLRIPTLVCCGAGMSRAPAIAAAALALAYKEAPEEFLLRVADHHPADVSPGLWSEVRSHPLLAN
jgi:hypothetical protein